jgi:hypothetical protein
MRYFVTKSGRQYFYNGVLWYWDNEAREWVKASHSLEELLSDTRTQEFQNELEFVFPARKKFNEKFKQTHYER